MEYSELESSVEIGGDMVNTSSRVGECYCALNDIGPLAALG